MAQIVKNGTSFMVLDEIQAQYPELIKLVLETESMDDNERQYWFDILPSMSDEQVDRLFEILDTEKKQLEELDQKYLEAAKQLSDEQLLEWQALQSKKAKEKILEKEAKDTAQNQGQPDAILDMLNNL